MHKEPVILIFDIGKTNRKCLLFDQHYQLLSSEYFDLPEAIDEEGFESLNLEALARYMRSEVARYVSNPSYDLKAFNITTYGATIVNTDRQGNPVHSPWDYLKPYDDAVLECFDERHGRGGQLFAETASPRLGNLNTGLQLFLLKNKYKEIFTKTEHSTWLPQWLSSQFTGSLYTESTSIGCHTLCWDFVKRQFPEWIHAEGMQGLFPPQRAADDPIQLSIAGKAIIAGIGMHDSSAALLPYLLTITHPFMLLSTGSWSICLNPFNDEPLTPLELANDCLCYLTYRGRPVKASRLDAGFRHERAMQELSERFAVEKTFIEGIPWLPELAMELQQAGESWSSSVHDPATVYYYRFMYQLVLEQVGQIRLVTTAVIRHLYVDGGFSRNQVFMGLLRLHFPQWDILAAEVGQSTALGAAIVLHESWNTQTMPVDLVRFAPGT